MTYHWYQSLVIVGTNKECIEQLEDGLHRMELGMADRLWHLEETLNRLSDILLANQEPLNHGNQHREGHDEGRLVVSSKTAKLEFPRFSRHDSTEWFTVKAKRFLWPPITWKVMPTSGGNGFAGRLKKKDTFSHEQISKVNSGLALGLRSAKIFMKPFQG